MSSVHLSTDSPFLPLKKGIVRLYSMAFCPYANRVRLVLAAKNIPYELVNIKLQKKQPKWYYDINPAGSVPALQLDDGRVLTDSMVVSEYIDNAFPENKLTPADPFVNAQHKLLIETFSKVMVNHMKVSKNVELTTSVPLLEEGFDYFEKKLHTKFFGGDDHPAFIDYMIWPWFERLDYLEHSKVFTLDPKRFPKLRKYIENMRSTRAVKETLMPLENKIEFGKENPNEPNYDLGIVRPKSVSKK